MTRLNSAMMRSVDPCLQIRKDKVGHRQMLFRFLGVAAERKRAVRVAHLAQVAISAPAVSSDNRSSRDAVFDECGERFGVAPRTNGFACARDNAEAQTAGINQFLGRDTAFVSGLPFSAAIFCVLACPDFNRANDRCLVVDASSLASRSSADATFVYLNGMGSSDSVAIWPNHTSAQLVKHRERCFVCGDSELALKLDRGLSRCLCRHEVSAPKPSRERHVTRLHDRSGGEGRIFLTGPATQNDRRPRSKAVRLADMPALRARKAIRPADRLQIAFACAIIGEDALELGKGRRKGRVHASMDSTPSRLCQASR